MAPNKNIDSMYKCNNLLQIASCSVFCVFTLILFRVSLVLVNLKDVDILSNYQEFFYLFLYGLQKDSQVALTLSGLCFGYYLICLFIRKEFDVLNIVDIYCAVYSFLFVFSIVYYFVFNSQFNYTIFIIDALDFESLVDTIIKGYRPLETFLLIVLLLCLTRALFRKFFYRGDKRKSIYGKFITGLSVLLIMLFPSIDFHAKEVPFGEDCYESVNIPLLQKSIDNPFTALYASFMDFNIYGEPEANKFFLPDNDIFRAVKELYPREKNHSSLDEYTKIVAGGTKHSSPSHIFYIVLESFGSWPFMDRYKALGLVHGIESLGRKGLFIDKILPSSPRSQPTIASILSGIPYSWTFVAKGETAKQHYPTAPAVILKDLGYKTRLFYGGDLNRQDLGILAKNQGFEELYGGTNIGERINHWGVDDKDLFNFIDRIMNDSSPSFNFVFTTTNHAPYSVDVYERGFHLKELPNELFTAHNSPKQIGHIWYTDKIVSEFVEKMAEKYPKALFVVTGDHPSIQSFKKQASFYETWAVPLLLFGNNVKSYADSSSQYFGNHIDISRTIIEMAAPSGHEYNSFGRNILKSIPNEFSANFNAVISSNYIVSMDHPQKVHAMPQKILPQELPMLSELRRFHNNYHAVSWYRLTYGTILREIPKM